MSLYKKPGSKFWWANFTFKGHRVQFSTKMTDKDEARGVERNKWAQLARGEVGVKEQAHQERVKVETLLDRLAAHYTLKGQASVQNISVIARAKKDFGARFADSLKSGDIKKYIKHRQTAGGRDGHGSKNATINRTTQVLERAYTLENEVRDGDDLPLLRVPKITHLKELNARQGFFNTNEMNRVLAHLPDDGLRDFVAFLYATGMRKGEAAGLTWTMVEDGEDGLPELHIPADICKNREARTLPIDGAMVPILKRRESARRIEIDGTARMVEFIFHRGGDPIREFRKSWASACVAAGVGAMVCPKCKEQGSPLACERCEIATHYVGKIVHDIRRSAVRDFTRSGVPQAVCMALSGHKTVSVWLRYNISNSADKREALRNTQAHREREPETVVAFAQKR